MKKDYYKVLGVDPKASADEIRRAFRRLAQEHHPDKGGSGEKFKEINEAYQILSDDNKRKQYDQFGTTFDGQGGFGGGGFGGFDPNNFAQGFGAQGFDFSDLGDIVGDMFGMGRRGGARRPTRGRDIEVEMAIDFKDAVFGTERPIKLNKKVACDACTGSGAQPGSKIITCKNCGGSGQVRVNQSIFFGTIQTVRPCEDCNGNGKRPEKICLDCDGLGVKKSIKEIRVKIPAGIDTGGVIKIQGQGEAGEHGIPSGDLYLIIRVKPDANFQRDHNNIHTKQEIPLPIAVLGGMVKIKVIDGEVDLKIPAGTQSLQVFKLKGRGVPSLHGHGRGDHLVEVVVKIPERLSGKEKQLMRDLAKEMGVQV